MQPNTKPDSATPSDIIPVPKDFAARAHITRAKYDAMYKEAVENPDAFWAKQAEGFVWHQKWARVKNTSFNFPVSIQWFEGAKTNISENCLDRHLETRGNQTAIIWEGDNPAESKTITYKELHEQVCRFANVLKAQGIKPGDRVTIYLPMIPEAAIAMLACARIGAVHSVVFGGFSADALAGRIEDCGSKLVITADESLRGGKKVPLKNNVDEALKKVSGVECVIVVKRSGGTVSWNKTDRWYHEEMAKSSADCRPESLDAEHPLYILYTSGSTGKPKGVLHTTGGYMVYASVTHKYTFDYHSSPRRGEVGRGASSTRDYPIPNVLEFARTLRKGMTSAEQLIWKLLRGKQLGVKFRKQHPVGPYIADFICLERKLIIELDGSQHGEDRIIKKDEERTKFLNGQGFEVLRFCNNDVFENTEGVIETIYNKILPEQASPHPNPPPAGEGVYWCTADVGWVTGHTYIVYGPLLNGATTLIFEGIPTYPDVSRFWQVVDKHQVNIFHTAPTAIRSLMREGDAPVTKTSRKSLKLLGSVGEPINPDVWLWYHRVVGEGRCPIVDTWWQTETGGHMIAPFPGATPLKPGSATWPFFGVQPVILDANGKEMQGACEGMLAIKDAWPGMMRTVFGNHKRFEETYFQTYPGYYFTGDGARRDADGYYWITGRADDVLKVSGHRIGTADIESALVGHDHVTEAAAVGYPHEIKGQGIYCYVTLEAGVAFTPEMEKDLKAWVRKTLGPIAVPDFIHFTPALPKTRSGKIMRRILRKIAEGDTSNLGDTSTLLNPEIVEELVKGRKS